MYVRQAKFHKTHGHDDEVEYIPANLEVVVWVQRYDFENHLSSEDAREHLERSALSNLVVLSEGNLEGANGGINQWHII